MLSLQLSQPQQNQNLNSTTVRDPHPPSHRLLASFSESQDLSRWKVFSDAAHGGSTAASLSLSEIFPGTAEFRGALAGAGAAGRARSGFAGMTAQLGGGPEDEDMDLLRTDNSNGGEEDAGPSSSPSPSPPQIRAPLDLSAFDALRLRVRNSDGRPWVVSLRTENWLVGDAGGGGCHDVWQAFLFAPDARRRASGSSSGGGGSGSGRGSSDESRSQDGWTTAELPLSRFLLTHRGRLVEARVSMNAARVVSLGLAPAPLPSSSSSLLRSDGNVEETSGDSAEEEAPYSPALASAEGAFCLGLDSITAVSLSRGLLTREEVEREKREREAGKT